METLSKKEKRSESKKRKAKAFLQLAKEIEEVKKEMEDSEEESGPSKKSKMAGVDQVQSKPLDELAQYKQLMRDRKKASMDKPKVYLLLDELKFQHSRQMSQDLTFSELPPLFLLDLQHLLLFALQGNLSSYKPRWCKLLRVCKVTSVVVMVMDAVSSFEFQTYPDCFPMLRAEFDMSAEMVSPEQYGSTAHRDLFNVPMSNAVLYKTMGSIPKKHLKTINKFTKPPGYLGENEVDMKEQKSDHVVPKNVDLITTPEEILPEKPLSGFKNADVTVDVSDCHRNDSFTRTALLLSSSQMIAEDFPLPIKYSQHGTYTDYVFSKDSYSTVTSQSPMFAVDCEMCVTSAKKYELTRISVINEDLETVYDSLVKPHNKIVDYVTRYSGITKFLLDPVKTRLEDVQQFLKEVLPSDAILCGQSLKGDLMAMQMFHPYVIDTSVIFNLSGIRYQKTSLKKLAAHFLGKTIQDSEEGHSSVEDAVTTMELVKLKLQQSPDFGDIANNGALYPMKIETNKHISSSNENQSNNSSLTNHHSDDIENQSNKSSLANHHSDDIKNKEDTDNSKNMNGTNKISHRNSLQSGQCSEITSMESEIVCTCKENKMDENCKTCVAKNTNNRSKNNQVLFDQKKAFFQQAGSQVYENFFKLMKKHNKMVGLIDKDKTLEEYKDDTMTVIPTTCDRETKSAGKSLVQFHDFVCMNFPSYRDNLDSSDEEQKLKLLRKQDKKMSKVLKHVRTNSLVAVVLTGRCYDGKDLSAKTFLKIT